MPPDAHGRLLAAAAALILLAELLAHGASAAWLGVSAFGIAVAATLLLVALPRVDPAGHGLLAISFAATALFTTVAFWSALPFAFGVAAIAAAPRPAAPTAILGALAMAVALTFCIIA